jgi:hypothetical protein
LNTKIRKITDAEAEQLRVLYRRKAKKYDEIASSLAKQYGWSEKKAREEAENSVYWWDEQMSEDPSIEPSDPIHYLLSDHYEICEQIMDTPQHLNSTRKSRTPSTTHLIAA